MRNSNRNDQRSSAPANNDATDKYVEFEGVVDESLPASTFKVKVVGGNIVLAVLSGKMKLNKIKVLPGDRVKVQVSPYDLTRGRIVYRQ